MLRIHGDVLYASAVAYAAGLIQAFIDEVYRPPTAVAGGPYTGDTCGAIVFDAGGSSDQIPGLIVAYDWDFTGDGVFDRTTSAPFTAHVYLKGFSGNLVLKVTDDDGLTDEDTAVVNAVSCPIVGRTDSRSERDVFGVGASGLIELLLWLLLVVYVRRRRLSKPAHRS